MRSARAVCDVKFASRFDSPFSSVVDYLHTGRSVALGGSRARSYRMAPYVRPSVFVLFPEIAMIAAPFSRPVLA
jgi:hypothetical protein